MAVRVRQYYQQPAAQELPQQPQIQSNQNKNKKRKRTTFREKVLYISFIVLVSIMSVFILHKQSVIQQTTIEIQEVESQISEVEKLNVGLNVQVNELSTYERIWEKAKALGLTLNEKNVKVVPEE